MRLMKEIKLAVEDKNLETVLTILNNLKSGLISSIKSPGQVKNTSQYKPKLNTIVREENSGTADSTGKYINPSAYKQRLKK